MNSDVPPESRPSGRKARQRRVRSINNEQSSHTHVVDDHNKPPRTEHIDAGAAQNDKEQEETYVSPSDNANDKSTARPDSWVEDAFRLYGKIAKKQDTYLLEQAQLTHEREMMKPKLSGLAESIDQIAHLARRADSEKSSGANASSWNEAYTNFKAYRQSFQSHMQTISDREVRISSVEYDVAKMQPKLLQIVDSHIGHHGHLNDNITVASSSRSCQSSLFVEPLAKEYLDKRGNLRLLQDRLQELMDGPDASDNDEDLGKFSPGADNGIHTEVIVEGHDRQREAVRLELDATQERLVELWHQCQAAGLDVGDLETETQRTQLVIEQILTVDQPSFHLTTEPDPPPFLPRSMLPRLVQDFRAAPLVEKGFTNFSKKRELIEDWVGKITLGKPAARGLDDNPPESPPEQVISAPRSDPERRSSYRDDVASSEEYVWVPAGGKQDPKYGPGVFQTLYRKALRRWRSSELLRPRYPQESPPRSPANTLDLNAPRQFERSHSTPNEL